MSSEPVENTTQEPVSTQTSTNVGESTGFQSASLYVGDLLPDVSEGLLFEVFNALGPVSSIRVCRDAVTRRSLGYAYVNFHQMADAERALDTMNFSEIQGKPCRIMWSQRDPSLRRSGVGNIFVKNLNETIDNKQLYDTFSLFGNILSCKVVTDKATGTSKGYGYVHYESGESARAAIEKLDGMLIDGQEVQVGEFMARTVRPGQNDFTNLYVKNIPYEWDDAKLHDEFAKFGEVVSAVISQGPASNREAVKVKKENESQKSEGKTSDNEASKEEGEDDQVSLGFGFVNFTEHESAVAAVEALNGTEVETIVDGETVKQELFVGRAQKKNERERELRAKFEAEKMDRISKFQGVNLYVKNLDESITDNMIRDAFAEMGTITSARVMMDLKTGRSKGFGFVCYSTPEEATRAVNEMNGKIMANKPIFVALAQRKEVRRAQLEAQHARGVPGQMMGRGMGGPMYPGMQPMYRPGPGGSMQPAYPMMPQMMGGRGPAGRGGFPMMQQPPGRGAGYPMPGYQGMPGRGAGGRMPGRGGRGAGRGPQQPGQPGIKFNQQVRNAGMPQAPMPQQAPAPQQAVPVPAPHEPLTAAALASASPEMQKNMIGERLYPLIHQSQPELAGKITGMLLEMDNSELLHLLESPDALTGKIDEAIQVLEAHSAAE
jgi:polyadenylate-binding protein